MLIPEGARRLEEAGNFGNLRAAAGARRSAFRGMVFQDSDVYKWLEALGWESAREPSRSSRGWRTTRSSCSRPRSATTAT